MSEPGYTPDPPQTDAGKAAAPIVDVTEPCPLCGEMITGKSRGKASLNWKMSVHKRNVHGVAGASKRSRKAPAAEVFDRHPIAAVASEMASEVRSSVGAPKTDELTAALARGFGLVNYMGASFAVESDRWIKPEFKDQTIAELTLPEDDLRAIFRPVGKLAAGTKVNERYGRAVVDNVDLIGSIGALVQVGMRWRTYWTNRRDAQAHFEAMQAGATATGQAPIAAPAPYVPEPGTVFAPSLADAPIRPDLAQGVGLDPNSTSSGRVMTAADVVAAQQQRAS